jgi:hypothetical protein
MFDYRLIPRRVGYTPATGCILLRRRFNGLFSDRTNLAFSTTGVSMTSTTAPTSAKHNWTAFELLMLAPFGLLLWYIGTQPLVLPAAPPAKVIVAEEQAAAEPVVSKDPDAPRFVTAGSSVLERIAPVARLTLEAQEAQEVATAPQEPAQAQVSDTPAVTNQAVAVPQEAALIRIEITDGTGVDGLAGELTSQLEKNGVTVSKTAHMPAGAQRRTVILYRDGFEEVAQRLGKLFTRPPALVNATSSRNASEAADVRLVLGIAAARDKALLASKEQLTGM